MKILDCTLRDGSNVVGNGFSAEISEMVLKNLIAAGIEDIEMGNAHGYNAQNSPAPLTDQAYLALIEPYAAQANLGMFLAQRNANRDSLRPAAESGLRFMRVGANAGEGANSEKAIEMVREAGLFCRYSLMKAYIRPARELAEEAALLEKMGAQEITIMDSAGTMLPEQVAEYVSAMKQRTRVPIGFHGHNNMGLSVANALQALSAGAEVFDTGLMGMARSAGNCATEVLVGVFQRLGYLEAVDFYALLDFIDKQLAPAMLDCNYSAAIAPEELILGIAGCHSSFAGLFREIAAQYGAPLYPLIARVSEVDQKAPSRELIESIARELA